MKKYSVEIIRNGELVENSAIYFTSEKEMLYYCKNENWRLEENEKYYVTMLIDDTWVYSTELTEKANLTI